MPDVISNGVVEQDSVLRHDAHNRAQGMLCKRGNVLSVHSHTARRGVIKAEQQP